MEAAQIRLQLPRPAAKRGPVSLTSPHTPRGSAPVAAEGSEGPRALRLCVEGSAVERDGGGENFPRTGGEVVEDGGGYLQPSTVEHS